MMRMMKQRQKLNGYSCGDDVNNVDKPMMMFMVRLMMMMMM